MYLLGMILSGNILEVGIIGLVYTIALIWESSRENCL